MFSDKCELRGKSGVKQLERIGAYVVITNRVLDDMGRSTRFTIVNDQHAWVASVHSTPASALAAARELTLH